MASNPQQPVSLEQRQVCQAMLILLCGAVAGSRLGRRKAGFEGLTGELRDGLAFLGSDGLGALP